MPSRHSNNSLKKGYSLSHRTRVKSVIYYCCQWLIEDKEAAVGSCHKIASRDIWTKVCWEQGHLAIGGDPPNRPTSSEPHIPVCSCRDTSVTKSANSRRIPCLGNGVSIRLCRHFLEEMCAT